MKIDKNLTRSLAQSGVLMNVIGGGMSLPVSKLKNHEDYYLFQLSIPGVDADLLSIEINNNNLFVFQKIDFDTVVVPYMIKRLPIPADVDFDQITAQYEGGRLAVNLPKSELSGGYRREVEIERQ